MEIQKTLWAERPNLARAETMMQGMLIVAGHDGTAAWMINPATGSSEPQRVDDSLMGSSGPSIFTSADISSLIGSLSGFKAAGHTVELLGKEDVAGSPTLKIKVTLKNGMATTYFLDAATFLPIKSSASARMAQAIQGETRFSNYRKAGGIMFAHTIDAETGAGSMHMEFEKFEINVPMDDSLSKMRKTDAQPMKR